MHLRELATKRVSNCIWIMAFVKNIYASLREMLLDYILCRQCEEYVHPVQNEIQDLGNAVSRVRPTFVITHITVVMSSLGYASPVSP